MPKLKHPETGRIVSVSRRGAEALRARGWLDPDVEVTPAAMSRPADTAVKAEWVLYAESRGVDPDGLTKAELVERVG